VAVIPEVLITLTRQRFRWAVEDSTPTLDLNANVDIVAIEEPLDIRFSWDVEGEPMSRTLSITMRTPGHDADLALGFVFGEGVLQHMDQVVDVRHCGQAGAEQYNVIKISLAPDVTIDWSRFARHVYTSSSCGVCGRTSIESVTEACATRRVEAEEFYVPAAQLGAMLGTMRNAQTLFDACGGVHAVGLFKAGGDLVLCREDVGRHNAFDKVVGHAFRHGQLPLRNHIAVLSGRASFELVQKAVMAGIPMVVAVGAPSSLAVELAAQAGVTLVAFARPHALSVYSHGYRIG